MKIYRSLIFAAALLCAAAGCSKHDLVDKATAVLPKEQILVFAAENAPEQTMDIYADGSWTAEVEAEWVHVNPMFGEGAMTVAITVDNNYDAQGVVDNPRSSNIVFRGASTQTGRFGTLTISQKGDTYKGKPEYKVSEFLSAEDEQMCKLPDVTVAALAKIGFIAIDATGSVFISGDPEGLNIGDKVFLNGKKGQVKGLPALILDETDVRGNQSVAYPQAKDITNEIGSYEATTSEFVSVSGSIVGLVSGNILSGAAIRIPGQDRRMMIADAPESAGLAQYNYHKVVASGYFNGTSGNNASFVVAKIEDKGLDQSVVPVPQEPGSVLFFDDFNWMDPYVAYYNGNSSTPLGKSVEDNNASGNAPNAYTTAAIIESGLMEEFTRRGYVDINAAVTSLYPQDTYWKFGKTSYHTGIRIPFVNYFGEVELSFDWSPHMTGSGNIDKVNPVVEVITGETAVVSDPFENDWQKGQMGWKNVSIKINITPESEIRVRPQFLEDHDGVDQMRWYIDNIKVRVPAPDVDPVYAVIESDVDLFTFEGTGGEIPVKITSDHDFTISATESWLSFDKTGGDADEATTITVKCEESELSVLRKAEVVINSADSELRIKAVQSAAGQELNDLISLDKNAVKVSYNGGNVKVTVQSNVEYAVAIDQGWVSEALTKAPVQTDELIFTVQPNDTPAERKACVTFSYGQIQSVLTITQPAKPKETILFEDDFKWLDPIVSEYNATGATPIGQTVETSGKSAEAPNIWNIADLKSAVAGPFAAKGYTDLNPSEKLMYLQDGYLKFSKTGGHNTALQLQVSSMSANPTDVEITFDYCMMVQGDGTIDAGPMGVYIIGDGTFENGTKLSDPQNSTQKTGEFFWNTTAPMKVVGATKNTKFVFLNQRVLKEDGSFNWAVSGAGRFFIDNIKIIKIREQVFKDDFKWLDPIVSEYNATGATPVGQTVETSGKSAEAPNIWNIAGLKSAVEGPFAAKGYTDLNSSEKLMYLQDGYLKFSKTGGHNTALQLQVSSLPASGTDVEITFDYCMMVQGDGTIDAGPMGVYIIGDGAFENGTKLSDPQNSTQKTGEFFWNHTAVLKASGVTNNTKFVFLNQRVLKEDGSFNWAVSGAGRFFIDNISICTK